jgi:uncharacterized protein (DUF4415 family)
MREISHIEHLDAQEVSKEEKLAKAEYKKRQREENLQEEREANDRKNAELKARMDRVVSKVGKPMMPRSTKKRIKKEVVEIKIDEDKLDYIRYLGEDFAMAATLDS